MSLEAAAAPWPPTDCAQGHYHLDECSPMRLDLAPLVRALLEQADAGVEVGMLAAWFHDQLALALARLAQLWSQRTGLRTVGLTGGVFANQRLTEAVAERLSGAGLRVLRHQVVPPNDGGLALGQASIAAARTGAR
jgi:hydrogenase maturation protein HypF